MAWIERSVIADVVIRVAGNIKDFHVGATRAELGGQLMAIHVGHDYVADEEMNVTVEIRSDVERFDSVASADDIVPLMLILDS